VNHLSPATPGTLRARFVQDMAVRRFTDKTRHDYIRTVAGFAAFLERSPAAPPLRTSVASRSISPSGA
jgi:integrase/recombinase XerD